MEKIPIDEIKKELKSAELSEEAIDELLEILSMKSLAMLEGWSYCFSSYNFIFIIFLFSFGSLGPWNQFCLSFSLIFCVYFCLWHVN